MFTTGFISDLPGTLKENGLIFPLKKHCDDRSRIITGTAQCPELNQLGMTVTRNIHQQLKLDAVRIDGAATSQMQYL